MHHSEEKYLELLDSFNGVTETYHLTSLTVSLDVTGKFHLVLLDRITWLYWTVSPGVTETHHLMLLDSFPWRYLEVIIWPPSHYQAYRPGSSILARGPIWSAGPICLVTRRWTCFNLFITCFFTTKTICSMVNSSVNKTCFDASEVLGFT